MILFFPPINRTALEYYAFVLELKVLLLPVMEVSLRLGTLFENCDQIAVATLNCHNPPR